MVFSLKSHRCLTKRTPFQPCSPKKLKENKKPNLKCYILKMKMRYYKTLSPSTFKINPAFYFT